MRLFASGAVSSILERTFPDDLPIENKMVSRAIEKAQTTVEGRNAEIRKEVLKYDEVLNEQRKVIYERRYGILSGEDLREHTLEVLEENITEIVTDNTDSDFPEEWDLDRLIQEVHMIYPTGFLPADLREAISRDQIIGSIVTEAEDYYFRRENDIPGGVVTMRAVEREIMLNVIDTKWREHLAEMDYLREGINLRAMGQQDPLVAWQREGFEMFTALMKAIDSDYIRIVMRVEVMAPAQPNLAVGTDLSEAFYQAGNVDSSEFGNVLDVKAAHLGGDPEPEVDLEAVKIGRNDLCWCGSGKKYKHCHGKNGD